MTKTISTKVEPNKKGTWTVVVTLVGRFEESRQYKYEVPTQAIAETMVKKAATQNNFAK